MALVRVVSTTGRVDEPKRLAAAAEAAMETFRTRRADPRECFEAYQAWFATSPSLMQSHTAKPTRCQRQPSHNVHGPSLYLDPARFHIRTS
jgi:hypothetical protein